MWFSCKPFIYIKTGDIFDRFVYVFNFHGRVGMMPQCTWEWCRSARAHAFGVIDFCLWLVPWRFLRECPWLILDDYLNTCTFVNYSPTERNIYWKWPLLTPSLKIPYVTIFNIPLYSLLLFIAAIYLFPAICLALQILELYN